MKLNQNSISSKLYRWFYGTKILPNNLCPYFWKVVLMYLTIIPYTLFSIPVVVYDMFDKDYSNGERKTGDRLGISAGVYIGILTVTSLITAIVGFFTPIETKSFWEFCQVLGCIVWFALIVFGGIEGVKYLREYSTTDESYYSETEKKWVYKKTKVNLTTEFIKAKYNKYCPKIDWIDNK